MKVKIEEAAEQAAETPAVRQVSPGDLFATFMLHMIFYTLFGVLFAKYIIPFLLNTL